VEVKGPIVIRAAGVGRAAPVHAFTTRVGGVSGGDFASLNFGNPGELPPERRDPHGNIRANWERVLTAIGAAGRELVEVHQVHGAAVHVVRAGEDARPGGRDVKADAIVTDDPRRVVAVRVADCAPVLMSSGDGRVVAAVHAGWRGVVAGVAPAAVAAMRGLGAAGIVAAVGPCIECAAFEVGEEVAAEFDRVFGAGAGVVDRSGVKPHVDLKRALRVQLERAGVDPALIEVLPGCTVSEPARFYSHRRDRERTGRMAAVIGPRERA
jgi:polyphenol oxidase